METHVNPLVRLFVVPVISQVANCAMSSLHDEAFRRTDVSSAQQPPISSTAQGESSSYSMRSVPFRRDHPKGLRQLDLLTGMSRG